MPSQIKVDQIAGATGSTVTLPSGQTLDLSSGTTILPSSALSALNATNLTSGTVPNARLSGITADKLDLISTASVPSITAKGTPSVSDGYIQLNCEQNSHGIKIKSPPHSAGATYTMVMPSAIGTSNQVLRMNSGATALEFGTVSSDVVKLASASTTSTHSTIDINGYFDDTIYSHYKLALHSVKGENTTGQFTAKFLTSSSTTNNANNFLLLHTAFRSGGTNGQQERGYENVNSTNDWNGTWNERNTSSGDTLYSSYTCDIYNPQSTTQGKLVIYQGLMMSGVGSNYVTVNGGYFTNNTTAMTGFRFYRDSGAQFYQSAWSLYGFKN